VGTDTKINPDVQIADLSSFKVPNNIIKKIGELARRSYEQGDPNDLENLTREEWTFLEEVITGFENR
jgi:hypothetical protein